MKYVLFAVLLGFFSQAFARTECNTLSRGYRFQDADVVLMLAFERTINSCTQHSETSNGECRYNIRCFGDGRWEFENRYVRCFTQSRDIYFADGDFERKLVEERVMAACAKHPSTDNSECRYYLNCSR